MAWLCCVTNDHKVSVVTTISTFCLCIWSDELDSFVFLPVLAHVPWVFDWLLAGLDVALTLMGISGLMGEVGHSYSQKTNVTARGEGQLIWRDTGKT